MKCQRFWVKEPRRSDRISAKMWTTSIVARVSHRVLPWHPHDGVVGIVMVLHWEPVAVPWRAVKEEKGTYRSPPPTPPPECPQNTRRGYDHVLHVILESRGGSLVIAPYGSMAAGGNVIKLKQ